MLVHNNQDVNTRPATHLGSFCPCKVIATVLGSSSPWFYHCEVVTQAEKKRLRAAREIQRTEKHHQFRNNNAKIVPSGNISPPTNFAHTSPSRGQVNSRYCRYKIGPFGLTSDDKGFTDNNRSSPTIIGNKSSTSSSRSQPPNNRHKLAPLTPHIETEVFVTHNKGMRTGISSTVAASSGSRRSVFGNLSNGSGKCRYHSSKRIGGTETRAYQPIKNKPINGCHLGPIDETDEKLEEFMDAWSSFGGGIFG
jgi:hypothetical protein